MINKFLPSISAAGAILIFFLLVLPSFDQTRLLRASIKEREVVLEEASQISAQIDNLNQELENKKSEVAKLDRLLPKQKEVPELLSSLEQIVSSSGMILSEINLSEVSGQSEIGKINGNLKMTGSFDSFINFLDLAEKNLRLIDISMLDVAAQLAEGSRVINFDIRFEVSYLIND